MGARKMIIWILFVLSVHSSTPISGAIDESNPRYRPISGYGNNIENPTWGSAGSILTRSPVPDAYLDGIGAVPGMQRASPRLISNTLSKVSYKGNILNTEYINEFHTYFGQFLVADMLDSKLQNKEELFYSVPAGDPLYDPTSLGNVTTGFYRHYYTHGTNTTGPRNFINPQTHYIDCSFIYGINNSTLLQWVDPNTGKLVITQYVDHTFPFVIPPSHFVRSGDTRFNKTPPLYAIGYLLYREHNRWVDQFAAVNPTWEPNQLFQEARRMVIAIVQSIAHREYLAATIGQALPVYTGYNSTVNPSIDIFFGAVSMRYGHSSVTSYFYRMDDNLNPIPEGDLFVHENLFNPDNWLIYNTTAYVPSNECIFRGISATLAGRVDVGIVDGIRGLMFHPPYTVGKDLFATNIMRAKDHGVPDYNTCRTYFGLPKKNSFAEITSDPRIQQALESLYTTVDDIDPYVGSIAEDTLQGLPIGELVQVSILDQFRRLRDGDRYWYENTDYFTTDEINLIHGTKFIDLVTRNFPDIDPNSLPTSAFFVQDRQLNSSDQVSDSFFFPSLINPPQYLSKLLLAPFYQLSWNIDYDNQIITYFIQVKGNGWVGIGFNPQPNTMKGADIVLCRVVPETNIAECRDSFALDVGVPTLDIVLGGTDDVISDSVSVSLVNGFVTATFSRKLNTGDQYDKPTTDLQPIIFAFNELTSDLLYHGPTRSSSQTVSFLSDFTGPPREVFAPQGITIFIGVIACLGLILSIILICLIMAFKPHFRLLTPPFCIIILAGTIIGYVFAILLIPEPTDALCIAQIWLLGLSYVLIFVSLFAKIYRVWRVLSDANNLKLRKFDLSGLIPPVVICIVLESAFLVAFTVVATPNVEIVTFGNNMYAKQCYGDLTFWGVFVGYKAAFLMVGVVLAILTRNMEVMSESKEVGFCLYIFALNLIVMIPIGFVIGTSPTTVSVIKAIAVVIPYISTTLILFGGVVVGIITGEEPRRMQTIAITKKNTASNSTGTRVHL